MTKPNFKQNLKDATVKIFSKEMNLPKEKVSHTFDKAQLISKNITETIYNLEKMLSR